MKKRIRIDLEGYPQFGELRITDEDVGREVLANLRFSENGALETVIENESFVIEAFDEPFVLLSVSEPSPSATSFSGESWWKGSLPYGLEVYFNLSYLCIDEWDRFHGQAFFSIEQARKSLGVPFVFSRKAQAQFFNFLEDFTDDSFCYGGQIYKPEPWLWGPEILETPHFWTSRYLESEKPGWEMEAPNPILVEFLPKIKLLKSRIAVLGCGTGNDAAFFAKQGHLVTAFDFSNEALTRAKKKYGQLSNIKWVQEDVLQLGTRNEYLGQFDLIFEHTCYCAIPPQKRNDLVKVWRRLLTEKGQILGIFFVMPKRTGPPFGGSEWEVRERLIKSFSFKFWQRSCQSVPERLGKELLVLAEKVGNLT